MRDRKSGATGPKWKKKITEPTALPCLTTRNRGSPETYTSKMQNNPPHRRPWGPQHLLQRKQPSTLPRGENTEQTPAPPPSCGGVEGSANLNLAGVGTVSTVALGPPYLRHAIVRSCPPWPQLLTLPYSYCPRLVVSVCPLLPPVSFWSSIVVSVGDSPWLPDLLPSWDRHHLQVGRYGARDCESCRSCRFLDV